MLTKNGLASEPLFSYRRNHLNPSTKRSQNALMDYLLGRTLFLENTSFAKNTKSKWKEKGTLKKKNYGARQNLEALFLRLVRYCKHVLIFEMVQNL